jgi:endopeptidase La
MNNLISINKYKIYYIQKDYISISKLILRLHKHIIRMSYLNILNFTNRNIYVNKIHNLIKILNTSYNNYILNTDDDIMIDLNDDILFDDIPNDNNVNETTYENIRDITHIAKIFPFKPSSPIERVVHELSIKSPLDEIKKNLEKIVKIIGMYSIIDILTFELGNTYNLLFEQKEHGFIQFLSYLIIPINYEILPEYNSKNIIEISESLIQHDELFNQVLQIKIKTNTGKLVSICGFIKNDTNNIILKTSQISNRYIYETKKNIEKYLVQHNINTKLKKIFMKYISIYDILIFENHDNYKQYFDNFQKEFIDINNKTLAAIMKIIGDKNITLTKLYKIIKYLLISDNDKIAMASIVFDILKDKKIGNTIIVDLIYDNLDYNIQIKLKKANVIIKDELEKISSLSIDDIDLKNQLLATKGIPENVKVLINEKIDEIKNNNGDYYKQLLFIKLLLKYPWIDDNSSFLSQDNNIIERQNILNNIKNKLDTQCYGHSETKQTILKIVGKWLSNSNSSGNALGFVGPPGIGKTLISKSLGDALNIPFIQITLGGQNDGELLHGHGYTYNSAQPGIIVKKMAEIGKARCIIFFDELDKACSKNGVSNEITSILIHLTDPVMNRSFQDRFFQGIDFPLDKVIFIFSYNDSSLIDPILLDRIQEINIKPYTMNDKIKIINNFIKPDTCKMVGFNNDEFLLSEETMEFIINKYTLEAGVRNLRRKIENIFLKLNLDKIYQTGIFTNNNTLPIQITKDLVIEILDKPNNIHTIIHPNPEIGIINGLFATTSGYGGIIPIQIFSNYNDDHNNILRLTGSQGDVMKESVQCAFTTAVDFLVKNQEKYLKQDIQQYLKEKFPYGFHIHAPQGATPKDGPSAGGAFTCAFISRILNRPIKNDIAITGEIDLSGKINQIGGLLYKIMGAKEAGVKVIYMPEENDKDYNDIKDKYKDTIKDITIVKVKHISEIIDNILI